MKQGVESIMFSTQLNEERSLLTMFIEIVRYECNLLTKIIIKRTLDCGVTPNDFREDSTEITQITTE